jgi:virginiamycin B lyase
VEGNSVSADKTPGKREWKGGRVGFALKLLALTGLVVSIGAASYGATVRGTVRGPDGAPFTGAFVQAQNTKTKIAVLVLSGSQGEYRVENLPPGDYRVQVQATGYASSPRTDVTLAADQNASFDFALQKGAVRWNELSIDQAGKLWPMSKAKSTLFTYCFICHGFQTRMASVTRDEDGWRDRVHYMQEAMHFSLGWRVNDADAEAVALYLNSLFGQDSVLPKSPEQMPRYRDTVQRFSSDAMNIVYVEYPMPGVSRMPFSAAPDKNGALWIPNFGTANKISRLNPQTGEFQDFSAPNVGTAAIHSAVPAPDGSVWLTEQGSNKLGRWDPATQKITEFQDSYRPGKEGFMNGGSKHTVRFDPAGNVWATGDPLSRFDPESKKFTDFWETSTTYSLAPDREGNMWFTMQYSDEIGKADWKTLKITKYKVPTAKSYPRRIAIDSGGIVWVGEFDAGKIARFDPKTETFKEYALPGPDPTPYGLGIDADHNIWYASYRTDVIGRLDPNTGKVTEYPFPHSENTIREFFLDSQGRMWYGTPSNNRVGYFYLTGGTPKADLGGE